MIVGAVERIRPCANVAESWIPGCSSYILRNLRANLDLVLSQIQVLRTFLWLGPRGTRVLDPLALHTGYTLAYLGGRTYMRLESSSSHRNKLCNTLLQQLDNSAGAQKRVLQIAQDLANFLWTHLGGGLAHYWVRPFGEKLNQAIVIQKANIQVLETTRELLQDELV